MERFFAYYRRHILLPDQAVAYLAEHGEVRRYAKGDFFMRPDERMPYWCMVLEGLACGYALDQTARRRIHWFALPMQGFAGVRHLYTPRKSGHYIQFLRESIILRIPALRMREAKERFAEVSELLHILKQHHIDRSERLREVLQHATAYGRYAAFMASFPQLGPLTDPEQQADFINVGRTRLFHVRKEWLKKGGR